MCVCVCACSGQYVSEKIGSAKGTELDDEFTEMEKVNENNTFIYCISVSRWAIPNCGGCLLFSSRCRTFSFTSAGVLLKHAKVACCTSAVWLNTYYCGVEVPSPVKRYSVADDVLITPFIVRKFL